MAEKASNGDAIASFVIRIRLEGSAGGEPGRHWVAHVTNVLERSERWFDDLDKLVGFLEKQLVGMGAAPRRGQRRSSGPEDGRRGC